MLNPFQKNKLSFSPFKQKSWNTPPEKPTFPIVDLYERLTGNQVKRKHYNHYVLALCPFHGEQNPSLALYPETNSYHCFSCSASGDIYKMVMELENKTFREALDYIRSL